MRTDSIPCSAQHRDAAAVTVTRERAAYLLRAARSRVCRCHPSRAVRRVSSGVYLVADAALILTIGAQ